MPSNNNNKDEIKGMKFSKYMVKWLVKAREFYIDSMTKCSSVAGYGSAMGCPSGHLGSGLARSFSATSTQDYGELLRLGRKSPAVVRRSCSVGIGRIDEDRACEFGDVDDVKVGTGLYSRSRTYAPAARRTRRGF